MLAEIAAAMSVAGGVMGALGSKEAADQQKDAIRAQVRLTRMQRAEELRRITREMTAIEGEARAAVGASGLQFSGSARDVLSDISTEHMRQKGYQNKATRLEIDAIKAGLPSSGATNLSMASNLLGGITAGIGAYSQAKRS